MENNLDKDQLPSWEVFIQPKNGKPFEHVGNVHGADKELAMQNARDLYTRRQEGSCIWIVESENIISELLIITKKSGSIKGLYPKSWSILLLDFKNI